MRSRSPHRRSRGTHGGVDPSQLSAAHLRDLQQQLQFLDMETKDIRKKASGNQTLDAQLRQVQASHDTQRQKFEGKWAAQQRKVHELETSLRVRTMQIERLTTEQDEHTAVYEGKLATLRARLEEEELKGISLMRQSVSLNARLDTAEAEKEAALATTVGELEQSRAECAAQRVALETSTHAASVTAASEARLREQCDAMAVKSAADDERVREAEMASSLATDIAERAEGKCLKMQIAHDEAVASHEQLVVKCDTAERQVQSLIADRAKLRTSHDDFEVTRRRIATARDKYQSLLVEAETKMKRLEFTKQENRRTIGALQSQVEDDLDAEKESKLLHEERMAEQITSLKAGQRREMGAMRSQLADLQEAYDRERTAKGMVEEALGEVRVERDAQQRRMLAAVSTQVAQEQELVQLRDRRRREKEEHAKELDEMKRLRLMAVEQQAAFDAFLSSHS